MFLIKIFIKDAVKNLLSALIKCTDYILSLYKIVDHYLYRITIISNSIIKDVSFKLIKPSNDEINTFKQKNL